jgi:hypothetical protein
LPTNNKNKVDYFLASMHIFSELERYNFVIFLSLGTTVATTTTSLPSPTTTEVSTPCDDVNLMTDSSRAPPGSITTNPAINPADLLAILNPSNDSPITLEVSTITITVSVEAEYTAIEVKGDNIKITKAEYIPVGTDVSTPLVSIQFDLITD